MAAAQPSSRQVQEVTEVRYTDRLMDDPAARRWLVNEGVCALLFAAPGDGGTIQMAGRGTEGSRKKNTPDELPLLKVGAESYGRLVRILEKNIPVTLELEMQNTFYDDPDVFNIIAEIPGIFIRSTSPRGERQKSIRWSRCDTNENSKHERTDD